jgi:cysteine desulfurase
MKVPPGFRPLLVGGPQEEGRRAGTENVPGVLAMVAALEAREGALASGVEAVAARLAVREGFEREVRARVPGVEVVGAGGAGRLWNTVSVLMPPADDCRRRWVVKLDRLGFAVSTGSACASGKEKPSHVLAAMGYRADESDRMLRFSGGWETGEEAWGGLVAGLEAAAAELRSGGRERR